MNRREASHIIALGALSSLFPRLSWGRDEVRKEAHSILFINLRGAPPQQEMFRPNYEAPRESAIRGPFDSIPTTMDGVRFSELFPQCAAIADRLTIIHSAVADHADHERGRKALFTRQNRKGKSKSLYGMAGPNLAKNGLPPDSAVVLDVLSTPEFLSKHPPNLFIKVNPVTGDFDAPEMKQSHPTLPTRRLLLHDLEAAQKTLSGDALHEFEHIREDAFRALTGDGFKKSLEITDEDQRKIFGTVTRGTRAALLSLNLAKAGSGVVVFNYSPAPGLDMHGREEAGKSGNPGIVEGMNMVAAEMDALHSGLLRVAPDEGVVTVVTQEFGRGSMNDYAVPGRDHDPRFAWVARGGRFKPGKYGSYNPRNGDVLENPIQSTRIGATAVAAAGGDPPQFLPSWKEDVVEDLLSLPPNGRMRQ